MENVPAYSDRRHKKGFGPVLKIAIKVAGLHLLDAEVYFLVRRRGQLHEYSSSADQSDWPPSREQLVGWHIWSLTATLANLRD